MIYDQILAYKERRILASDKYRELFRKSKDPLVLETIDLMNDAEKELFEAINERTGESLKDTSIATIAHKLGLVSKIQLKINNSAG